MMAIQKHYVIDTNVLLEDPDALSKLRNGNENQIYIPYHVLLELNKFKKSSRLRHIVARVVQYLNDHPNHYKILNASGVASAYAGLVDNFILKEILNSGLKKPILVTNDKIFQLQAGLQGVQSETYKESVPFKSEAEYYSGFLSSDEDTVPNAFKWNEKGKPVFLGARGEKLIDYQHKIWNDTGSYPPQFNPKYFEVMPLAFIRGMNIENAVVIIDEMQNMARSECRALLSRMSDGVKCICLGDIQQVDNPYLNQENNGLNWVVKKFIGSKIYSHLVLRGEKSRGPITDLVINRGL